MLSTGWVSQRARSCARRVLASLLFSANTYQASNETSAEPHCGKSSRPACRELIPPMYHSPWLFWLRTSLSARPHDAARYDHDAGHSASKPGVRGAGVDDTKSSLCLPIGRLFLISSSLKPFRDGRRSAPLSHRRLDKEILFTQRPSRIRLPRVVG